MLEAELGFKGERGYSNYEIAVKNGYQGTEQEWLAQFGVDFNVCVMKDDIAVYTGTIDPDDPDFIAFVSLELPAGWTKDNTIVLCAKERAHATGSLWENVWQVRPLTQNVLSMVDLTYSSETNKHYLNYGNQYYNVMSYIYDYQITLMKVDIPQV